MSISIYIYIYIYIYLYIRIYVCVYIDIYKSPALMYKGFVRESCAIDAMSLQAYPTRAILFVPRFAVLVILFLVLRCLSLYNCLSLSLSLSISLRHLFPTLSLCLSLQGQKKAAASRLPPSCTRTHPRFIDGIGPFAGLSP